MSRYQHSIDVYEAPGDWAAKANCLPGGNMADQIDSRPNDRAKAICNGCDVVADCLAWNLAHNLDPTRGQVVGGLYTFERQRLRHLNG